MSEALTHGDQPRQWRLCRCAQCGQESVCTPSNDFYTLGTDRAGPLYCEGCFWSIAHKKKETQ